MKKLVQLYAIVILLIGNHEYLSAQEEKLQKALNHFYFELDELTQPKPEGYCGFGASIFVDNVYIELNKMELDFGLFLEDVIADQSKSRYWQSALYIYVKHHSDDPFMVQKKILNLLDRDYDFNSQETLFYYIGLLSKLTDSIYLNSKAAPEVYTYFLQDQINTESFWSNKIFQQHKTVLPIDEKNRTKIQKTMDDTTRACVTQTLDIACFLYLFNENPEYYQLILDAQNSSNRTIRSEANRIATQQHLDMKRKMLKLK